MSRELSIDRCRLANLVGEMTWRAHQNTAIVADIIRNDRKSNHVSDGATEEQIDAKMRDLAARAASYAHDIIALNRGRDAIDSLVAARDLMYNINKLTK